MRLSTVKYIQRKNHKFQSAIFFVQYFIRISLQSKPVQVLNIHHKKTEDNQVRA